MKIARTTAHTLRVPYQFPLIKETQHAIGTFVEIETDDGLKGHAFSGYPMRFSIADFPHLNMHLHAGLPNGGRVEFHAGGWRIGEALFDGTPSPVKGWVTLPEAPGLGFTPKSGILDLAVKD